MRNNHRTSKFQLTTVILKSQSYLGARLLLFSFLSFLLLLVRFLLRLLHKIDEFSLFREDLEQLHDEGQIIVSSSDIFNLETQLSDQHKP